MNKSPFSNDTFRDTECQKYARLLGAYLDGELEAGKLLEVEGHTVKCETCRERVELDRAVRGTVKKVVNAEVMGADAKSAMRARMLAAMGAAQRRSAEVEAALAEHIGPAPSGASKIFGWRTVVPLSSAAALALLWGSIAHSPLRSDVQSNVKAAGFGDPLAGFVAMHRSPLPMERTDPQAVRGFEQYVGVPVRPSTFEKRGAHLVGGRLMPVNADARAALLEYRVGQGAGSARVSVFIYDPHKIEVSDASLEPRAVGAAQVRVGRSNGYSVAVTQNRGIGYALASDLDTDRSAELAALAAGQE
jgi:anti-sigma factor RsiW